MRLFLILLFRYYLRLDDASKTMIRSDVKIELIIISYLKQRSLWIEFRQKWPEGYWDDWMREPENR